MAVDDIYTTSLLHMNGVNGSTSFTDESGKTWTANGNAQINTTYYKFGGASGLFDGSGDYVDTPDSDDFYVASNDFTIDCWARRAGSDGADRFICGQANSSLTASTRANELEWASVNKPLFNFWSGGTAYQTYANSTITDSNWHHIAVVRYSNSLMMFVDGTKQSLVTDLTGKTSQNSSNKFSIGRTGEHNGYYWNGSIDEFRFSNGIARWTSNFIPPIAPYAPIPNVLTPMWFF